MILSQSVSNTITLWLLLFSDSTDDTESTDSAKKNKPDIKLEYKNQDTDYSGEPWRTDYDKDQYRYSAEYDELHQDVTYGKVNLT